MALETATVIAVLAIASLVSGAILLINGSRARSNATASLWALANLFIAIGVTLILQQRAIDLAFLCIVIAAAIFWAAMVLFNHRSVPAMLLVGGGAIWALLAYSPIAPSSFGSRAGGYMSMIVVYLGLCAWELWQGRAEKLPARWPLLGLVVFNAGAALAGVFMILPTDALSETPRADFLPIYLSVTAFVIGSAMLVIAMIKERAVAGYRSEARTDSLTGLANRAALLDSGAELMQRSFSADKPLALVAFDLDRFKSVNDTFGHQTGDFVLRRFAEAAAAGLRPGDMIGRIGGEEFLAIIPGADEEAAMAIGERVRRAFAESASWVDGRPVQATVSAGVAVGRHGDRIGRLEELLDRADRALYAAKADGRNRASIAPADTWEPVPANLVRLA